MKVGLNYYVDKRSFTRVVCNLYILKESGQIIVIGEDDSSYRFISANDLISSPVMGEKIVVLEDNIRLKFTAGTTWTGLPVLFAGTNYGNVLVLDPSWNNFRSFLQIFLALSLLVRLKICRR